MPEMLWAALAACAMPREEYLSLFRKVNRLRFLAYPGIKDITITGISLCSVETRSEFLNDLLALDERLRPILDPASAVRQSAGSGRVETRDFSWRRKNQTV